MLRTNQQVLVAACLTHIHFFNQTPFGSQNLKMLRLQCIGRGVGSLFEVKSFPGESYSQHHVVRDQQVVKGGVVRHRPKLQANPVEDLDFNLLIKMEWTENLGQCVILKGSLSSKKSGFHLTWQPVFAIIGENHSP